MYTSSLRYLEKIEEKIYVTDAMQKKIQLQLKLRL